MLDLRKIKLYKYTEMLIQELAFYVVKQSDPEEQMEITSRFKLWNDF